MRLPLVTVLALAAASCVYGQVQIGINIGPAPYYGYAPREVVYVERYVPAYDVPRVLVFSRYAGMAPMRAVEIYRRGHGWDRMCRQYRVPREALYDRDYGRGRDHHKRHGRGWDRDRW